MFRRRIKIRVKVRRPWHKTRAFARGVEGGFLATAGGRAPAGGLRLADAMRLLEAGQDVPTVNGGKLVMEGKSYRYVPPEELT